MFTISITQGNVMIMILVTLIYRGAINYPSHFILYIELSCKMYIVDIIKLYYVNNLN